jgi:hypothetical protein
VLGNPVRLTDLSGMGPDGIKGGGAPLADDGVPITYLSDVVITARCEYCYLNAVITTFGNGNYLGGQPTLSGVGVNAPHDLNEGDAAVGLDVIGTSEIPGLSTAADVGSGLLSVKNGDYLGGGISLAASIPAVGVLFNGAKWVRRMFKWGDEAAGVGKAILKNSDGVSHLFDEIPYIVREIEGFYVRSKQVILNSTMYTRVQSLAGLVTNGKLSRVLQFAEEEALRNGASKMVIEAVDIYNDKLFNPEVWKKLGYVVEAATESTFQMTKTLK